MAFDLEGRLRTALKSRYAIERELGHGGMAIVYLAADRKHDRRVAIKVLRPELAAALGPERFLREIRVAAQLSHPHIVPLYDSGEAGGFLYYAMPYVEGESLRSRLEREGQLPIGEAVQITHDVADALSYAHSLGLVHRDIKPENVLLSGGHALVADFGIARALDAAGGEKLTETGLAIGTPAYMSPEQAAGSGRIDGRSDLYSLGCVLYEMLAGGPPFMAPSPQAVLARHTLDPVPPLRTLRTTVSEALAAVVNKALAKAPADRFVTATEFAAALSADAPVPPRKRISLSRARLGLGAMLTAALGVALWLALRSHPRATLDINLVAVAPFDVLDPKLELWREGLVDLLARNRDGAGSLRTVSPTVVMQGWHGHSDPVSAKDLARRTGAQLVLYGQLSSHGSDSTRLTASLLDVASGRVLAQFDRPDQVDRVDRLADSLTIDVLRSLGPGRVGSVWRLSSMGTKSLPALNAFLRGEQYLRRAAWDSAVASFGLAIELDSGFALAIWVQAQAVGWSSSGTPYDMDDLLLRAGAHNRGLAPRDSLLIAADSLSAAYDDSMNPAAWTDVRRRFSTLDLAARRYPTDPLVWYQVGEARYHAWTACQCEPAEMLEAFDRVIRLDSSFAPAYIHAIQLAHELNAPTRAMRYFGAYLALHPTDYEGVGGSIAAALEDKTPWPQMERLLDTASANVLFSAWALAPKFDSAETAVRLLRLPWPGFDTTTLRRGVAGTLAFRGHLREAFQNADARFPVLFATFAQFGMVSPDSAAAVFHHWLSGELEDAATGLRWWIATHDTLSLVRLRQRADSITRRTRVPSRLRQARGTAELARVALVLARGDSAGALRQLLMLPDSLCAGCHDLLFLRFQLLAAAGRDREAVAFLDRDRSDSPSQVLAWLERGHMSERLGDREQAVQSYQFVADAWRNADPELQPYVREAKAALARVGREPRPSTP